MKYSEIGKDMTMQEYLYGLSISNSQVDLCKDILSEKDLKIVEVVKEIIFNKCKEVAVEGAVGIRFDYDLKRVKSDYPLIIMSKVKGDLESQGVKIGYKDNEIEAHWSY